MIRFLYNLKIFKNIKIFEEFENFQRFFRFFCSQISEYQTLWFHLNSYAPQVFKGGYIYQPSDFFPWKNGINPRIHIPVFWKNGTRRQKENISTFYKSFQTGKNPTASQYSRLILMN
jgi:hypothetical protein